MFQSFTRRVITRTIATPLTSQFKLTIPFTTTTRQFTTTHHKLPQFTPTTLNAQSLIHNQQYKFNMVTNTNNQPQTLFNISRAQFHIKLKVNRHKRDRIGYKSRPHHASEKRFWQTGSGRLMRFKSGMNHKRRRKTKNQLRRLSKRVEVPKQAYRRLTKMMMLRPYRQFPPGMSRPVNKFWQPPKDASKIKAKRWC